jgi:hypothetical protein
MARGINLADLAALPNDATLVADQEIDALEVNAHRRRVQGLANNILTGLRDRESLYAGSGQPTRKPQGKLYLDTDDSLYKGYKTSAGTPVALLDASTAYAQDLSSAGTATGKLGFPINVDTDESISNPPGLYEASYSLPADTLSADGQSIETVVAGTDPAGFSINFGDAEHGLSSRGAWIAKQIMVRTASGAQRGVSVINGNRDDSGLTNLVGTVSGTEDETAAISIAMKKIRVGFVDGSNDALRMYDFNENTFVQVGADLNISTVTAPSICEMNATRVAYVDATNNELRAYDFDGSTFSLTGSGLSLTAFADWSHVAGMSSSRIAFADNSNNTLTAFDFDGSSWTKTGNDLSISDIGGSGTIYDICATTSYRIVMALRITIPSPSYIFRIYDFDGTDWTQAGDDYTYNVGTMGGTLTALRSNRFAHISYTLDTIQAYDISGTTINETGNASQVTSHSANEIIALSDSRVAIFLESLNTLRIYDFDETDWTQTGSDTSITVGFRVGMAAMPVAPNIIANSLK